MDTQHFIKAVSEQGKFVLDWRNWGYGLVSGIIYGAASGGSSWVALAMAKAAGLDVHILNWKELGIVCATGGVVSALAYLKQSPLPPKEEVTTQTQTTINTQTVITAASPPQTEQPK